MAVGDVIQPIGGPAVRLGQPSMVRPVERAGSYGDPGRAFVFELVQDGIHTRLRFCTRGEAESAYARAVEAMHGERPLDAKCKTCRFFRQSASDLSYGDCRRYPRIMPMPGLTGGCYFPYADGDDWCGEWQRRRSTEK